MPQKPLQQMERINIIGCPLGEVKTHLRGYGSIFIIHDRNVGGIVERLDIEAKGIFPIEATEERKTLSTLLEIEKWLLEEGADREAFVLGVGGGITTGARSVRLAIQAEHQGAYGVVMNAPTSNEVIRQIKDEVDIPVVITVVSERTDIQARLEAGADFLNVSAAARTPEIVAHIRKGFPEVPIIATGGPTEESILATIRAGANAITCTPPSTGDLFAHVMEQYRTTL